jgi:hypothetical protein
LLVYIIVINQLILFFTLYFCSPTNILVSTLSVFCPLPCIKKKYKYRGMSKPRHSLMPWAIWYVYSWSILDIRIHPHLQVKGQHNILDKAGEACNLITQKLVQTIIIQRKIKIKIKIRGPNYIDFNLFKRTWIPFSA